MGFEKDALQFRTTQVDGIPKDLEPLVELLLHSKSIDEAIQSGQVVAGFSYVKLFKSLQWLRDRRVLKNSAISVFIDQNQSEYFWPRSLLKFPLLEFSAWRNVSLKNQTPPMGFSPWVLVLPMALVFICNALGALQGLLPSLEAISTVPPRVVVILIALSWLRTVQALGIAAVHELLGLSVSLRWILSPVSLHLEAADRGHPELRPLLARFQIGIAALCPLSLWMFSGQVTDSQLLSSLGFATCLWLLTEFSPLTQSELTLGLKDLFGAIGSRRLAEFQNIHRLATGLWISLVGIFLALGLKDHLSASFSSFLGNSSDSIPAFFFLLFIAFFIFSVLDEVLQGTGALEASTTTQMRRIFSTDSSQDRIKKIKAQLKDPSFFSALPIIQFFPPEAQAHFHSTSQLIRVRKGQRVCRQGEFSRELYVLLDGSLRIFRHVAGLGRDYSARIFPTSVFGELAFFAGVPRTASVIAVEDSLVVKIPHSARMPDLDLEAMRPIRNAVWALQAMSQSSTLSGLPAETLSLLLRNITYQHFERGATIAIQGDIANFAMVVVEGEVLVSQNGTPIRTIRKGELAGEIGLLITSAIRTATLQASTAVLALIIQRDDFKAILRADLGLAMRVEKLMLSRLASDRARPVEAH